MASDPPPAYCTLVSSTTHLAIGAVQHCVDDNDDRAELLESSFHNKTTRVGFAQKVLAVKFLQSLWIVVVLSIFKAYARPVQRFLERGYNFTHLIAVFALVLAVWVLLLARVRSHKDAPRSPARHLLLVLHPLTLACLVAVLTVYLEYLEPVLVAWMNYCGVGFVLLLYSIFALQTKLEFALRRSLALAAFAHIVLYAVSPLFGLDAFYVLYPTAALALHSAYVLWTLEEMVGPHYSPPLAPAHFLDAALNLHLDYYRVIRNAIYPTSEAGGTGDN